MGLREGAAEYARQRGKTAAPELKTLAETSIGRGRLRQMAQSGNQDAKQVLKDHKAAEVEQNAAYDA